MKNRTNSDEFLVVKRPDDDVDLAGGWGFPATSMQSGELPEQAAQRICKEKLGCTAEATRFLGLMFQKRNNYDLFLMDIEMLLAEGSEPDITKATTTGTAYVEQQWSTNPLDLMPSAQKGSCYSSIFLADRGLLDRKDGLIHLKVQISLASLG